MLAPFLVCGILVRKPTWRTALFLFLYILVFTGIAFQKEMSRPQPRERTQSAALSTRV